MRTGFFYLVTRSMVIVTVCHFDNAELIINNKCIFAAHPSVLRIYKNKKM